MFFKTIDFSKYSSIKVGQPAEVLMIELDDKIPSNRYLIGGANNLLISPTPPPLMMLSKDFATIEQEKENEQREKRSIEVEERRGEERERIFLLKRRIRCS